MPDDPKNATKKQKGDHSIEGDRDLTKMGPNESPVWILSRPILEQYPTIISAVKTVAGLPTFSNLWSEYVDEATLNKQRALEAEVAGLKLKVDEQAKTLRAETLGSEEKQKRVETLEQTLAQLSEKERLSFLLARVNQEAQRALLDSSKFRERFLTNNACSAFVMSVHIRRSTELMLKARRAELFASFITTLCNDLINSVFQCNGVFDKFTGDGILAFFPEFFAGPDAGYYTLLAADRCHKAFQARYQEYRGAFNSILMRIT